MDKLERISLNHQSKAQFKALQQLFNYTMNHSSNELKNLLEALNEDNLLILKEITIYYPVLTRINEYLENHDNLIIAIDGMCGSGKTTLGYFLHEVYDSNLYHMDDFYLQPIQRTKERYETPGENVDHERFKKEVLLPTVYKETVHYQRLLFPSLVFDSNIIEYPYKSITIVEGTYSLNYDLRDLYDLKIFVRIDPGHQLERLSKREGDNLQNFIDRWIPLESLYFNNESFKVDLVVDMK